MKLSRNSRGVSGVFGDIADESGEHVCVILEHAYEQADGSYLPKIAPGIYDCVRGTHRLEHYNDGKPFETFEITGVPNFMGNLVSKCLFHPGNFNLDSNGCLLTGVGKLGQMITNSRTAFASFMKSREGCDSFELIVEEIHD